MLRLRDKNSVLILCIIVVAVFFVQGSTSLAKKIETATQVKHRRMHAREITRLCQVRAIVSIFFWQG